MKLAEKLKKLETCLKSKEPLPITPLPYGLNDIIGPSIFVGHKYHRVILYPKEITLATLEKLFKKAIKDCNSQAILALFQYTIYNKKTFWRRYKSTKLGAQVMAEVLGKHE